MTTLEHKAFDVIGLKMGATNDPPGTFEAIVAVFGNIDRGGDLIEPGAFKATLAKSGRGLPPVVWSHAWEVPPIGALSEAYEVNGGAKSGDDDESAAPPAELKAALGDRRGLYVKGRLFIDTANGEDSPMARQVYTAMNAKDGRGQAPLREFSFGYAATNFSYKEIEGQQVRFLKAVEVYEVGPTLVGMNPATELLAMKAAALADAVPTELDDKPPNAPSAEEAARIEQLLAQKPSVVDGPTQEES